MCKRSYHWQTAAEHPYEGATVHLHAEERHSCGQGGFPWWTLWLIWPAIWLVKGVSIVLVPLFAGASLWQILIAAILIGAGVALLIADRRRG